MAYITLDFDAYRQNLEYMGQKVGDISKVMAVLKDNAYGHGLEQMAPLAAACGIKRAVVKNTHEASVVAPFFEKVLILIEAHPKSALVNDKFIYACDDLHAIDLFPNGCTIHLKVDTGMRRNGVMPCELEEAFKKIRENGLNLEGIFTHFYGADMLGSDFYVQNECYKKVKIACKELAKKHKIEPLYFHSRNSAAILRINDDFDDDFVRAGIASYGYTDLDESFGDFNLKPVLALWADRLSTRELKKGDVVGYGGVFAAKDDMVVSSYDLGYGDGLFRQNGENNLHVKNGKLILGRMSMDCFSLEGDEDSICVFDNVKEYAKHFKTITYEILTQLSPFLKRVVKPYTNN